MFHRIDIVNELGRFGCYKIMMNGKKRLIFLKHAVNNVFIHVNFRASIIRYLASARSVKCSGQLIDIGWARFRYRDDERIETSLLWSA